MIIYVEQIVEVNHAKLALKKVLLSRIEADILPVSLGDDLWFINIDDGNKRTRLITVNIRMAVSDGGVYAIIDVMTPELLAEQKNTPLFSTQPPERARVLDRFIGSTEMPAGSSVPTEPPS